jgi:hypothetical protein
MCPQLRESSTTTTCGSAACNPRNISKDESLDPSFTYTASQSSSISSKALVIASWNCRMSSSSLKMGTTTDIIRHPLNSLHPFLT